VAKAKPKTAEPTPPPPLILDTTIRFDWDLKQQKKRRKSLDKLHTIIETLRNRRPLDPRYKDHALGGEWNGWRDCHLEPDWVLIYRDDDVSLTLGRTGSHSDLFDQELV
jgi:mRNA interferase YafQ